MNGLRPFLDVYHVSIANETNRTLLHDLLGIHKYRKNTPPVCN